MKWSTLISVSFICLVIGFWKKNDLAKDMDAVDSLATAPVQKKVRAKKFTVNVNDVDYEIKPLYDYELYGMIVSYKVHDGDSRLHKLWNDHLNVADYCVVWGKTALASTLAKVKIWNGQFTCNFSTRDQEAWENLNQSELSNNHLISADEVIRKNIDKIRIGDQIRIKGQLAEYTNLNTKSTRGTSISRDDKGNGACETIYVSEIDILKSYSSVWRKVMYIALFIFLSSLFFYFKAPYRVK